MNSASKQSSELSSVLKNFAFEESPMFRRDHVQEMAVSRSFVFIESLNLSSDELDKLADLPIEKRYKYFPVKTVIALGFSALRDTVGNGYPPEYTFEVSIRLTTSILPTQLVQLASRDTRDALYIDMTDIDVDFDEEDASTDAHALREQRDDELLSVMHENGIECERFQAETLRFDTCDQQITPSYSYGYIADKDQYQVCDSSEEAYGGYSECVETPEGTKWIDKPDQGADGAIEPNSEPELDGLFADIIGRFNSSESLGDQHLDAESNQLLYVVECLRQKTLTLPKPK